jgi:hypothetical protein
MLLMYTAVHLYCGDMSECEQHSSFQFAANTKYALTFVGLITKGVKINVVKMPK